MIKIIAPEYIQSLSPYVPGKPIAETKREFNLKNVIKLASNENPLGPSPKAIRSLKGYLEESHLYPDASAYELKQKISKTLQVSSKKLVIGNGSNEIIDLLIRAYCIPGDQIVTSKAAFIAYRICAQIQGVSTLEARIGEDLVADLDEMANLVEKYPKVKIVFLANPNNPTGTYNSKSEVLKFLKRISNVRGGSVLVALDYAYWEYVTAPDLPDPMELLKLYPDQVVVLRTFSKIYGLAGLRAGYAVASEDLIQTLEKVRQPFNLNSLALRAATYALEDRAFVTKSNKLNQKGMKLWTKALDYMEIPYWNSQGNFILIDTSKGLGKRGGDVFDSCLRKGVIFRPVANYGLLHALRVSIGTEVENRRAIEVLAAELPSDRYHRFKKGWKFK